jgi:hypothetical protein
VLATVQGDADRGPEQTDRAVSVRAVRAGSGQSLVIEPRPERSPLEYSAAASPATWL